MLCAALLVLVPAYLLGYQRTETLDDRSDEISRIQSPPDVWMRDELFLSIQNSERLDGYLLADQVALESPDSDRIRVLVVGDSATWGSGLLDPQERWPHVLERRLNDQTAPGTFEVVTIAYGGASVFSYVGWLEALASGDIERFSTGKSDLRLLSDSFDVLVVGWSFNDTVPAPASHDPFLPPDVVAPSWEDYGAVLSGVSPNPNTAALDRTIERLGQLAGEMTTLVVDVVYPHHQLHPNYSEAFERLAAAGFTAVPPMITSQVSDRLPAEALVANPANIHPGGVLQRAIAQDAATALLDALPPSRIARASEGAVAHERELIANHVPVSLDVEIVDRSRAVVRYIEETNVCQTNASLAENNADVFCVAGLPPATTIDGKELPTLNVLCAAVGHPYAYIGLDRVRLASNPSGAIRVSVDSDTTTRLMVLAVREDADGIRSFHTATPTPDEGGSQMSTDNLVGIAISDVDADCSMDRQIGLPSFVATIDTIPSDEAS